MNDHDQLERMLGHELHDRADGLTGLPFGFDEVKGRAGRIRRNRRIAGGVAVAAAVGLIVPTVMAVSGSLQSQGEILPADQPGAPVAVARTTLTLDGLERGEDPGIEYFTPDGVVLPGEGLQELDLSYQGMVAADDGWVAVEQDRQGLRYLSDDFQPQGGASKTDSFVTMPDRSAYAFVMTESGAQTLTVRSTVDPERGFTWDLPATPVADVVGFLAEDRVVYQMTDQSDGTSKIFIAEPDGSSTELPGYVKAVSASPVNGLVAVQTKSNEDASGCFGVVDPDVSTRRPVWETCENSLGDFSPDGQHLMASDAYGDGFGLRSLEVLDAETGTRVAIFKQASDTMIDLVQPAWEDDDSIVTVAFEADTQTMVRLDVDGGLEEATETVEGMVGDLYYYLGQDRQGL